jgi:hypothetical protein
MSDLLHLYNTHPNRLIPNSQQSPMGEIRQDNINRSNDSYYNGNPTSELENEGLEGSMLDNENIEEYYTIGTQQSPLKDESLGITALDIENSEAGVAQGGSGGPQRTNAGNSQGTVNPDGTYIVRGSGGQFSPYSSGVRNKNGSQVRFTLHNYLGNSTYSDYVKEYRNANGGFI